MATIRNNDLQFIIKQNYSLISGSYVVTDSCVTSKQPSEVAKGVTLQCNASGIFRFRVGRKGSAGVANWFNNQLNTQKNTTFAHAAGSLNFAFTGKLLLTVKNNKTGALHSLSFDDVVIAQGHSGAANNWWFGSKSAYALGDNKISLNTSSGNNGSTTLICRRGGNAVNVIDIENIYHPSWMKGVRDDIKMNALNIPGTHDSGTGSYSGVANFLAKTQSVSIKEQLDSGVRYLDIRCRHIDNSFAIHHGVIYTGINFDNVIEDCVQFLKENKSECVLMQVKEEYDAVGNSRSFYETFESYVARTKDYWVLNKAGEMLNDIPALSELRGRIFLVRRFDVGAAGIMARSINLSNWPDNQKRFEVNLDKDEKAVIQDQYKNAAKNKIAVFGDLANESSTRPAKTWFINFSSTTTGITPLSGLAAEVNKGIGDVISHSGFVGTVVMDYPESQHGLIDSIIHKNTLLNN